MPDFFDRNKDWSKPGPYVTQLSPAQENQFSQWVDQNRARLGQADFNDPKSDYDMRGWWLENNGSPAPAGHFPDTYKTPYHESFSNESKYANDMAPKWVLVGNKYLLATPQGQVVFSEPSN